MFDYKGDVKIFSKWFCDTMKEGNHLDIMSLILDVDVTSIQDHYKRTLLHISAAFGNKEVSLYLIDSGCDVDAQDSLGYPPIIYAIHYGYPDIVRLLIAAGADVFLLNSRQMSPYVFVTIFRHQKKEAFDIIVKPTLNEKELTHFSLAKNIKDYHKTNMDPLYLEEKHVCRTHSLSFSRLYFKYPEIIEIDLMYLSDAEQKDFNGNTALHALAVVKSDNCELFEKLLDSGADVNVENNCGVTPLHVACSFGNINFVRLLLRKNAEVYNRDFYGRTPLYAALTCRFEYYITRRKRLPLLTCWEDISNPQNNEHEIEEYNHEPRPHSHLCITNHDQEPVHHSNECVIDHHMEFSTKKFVSLISQQLMWLLLDRGAIIDKDLLLRCICMDGQEIEHHHYLLRHVARLDTDLTLLPLYFQDFIQALCCKSYYKKCYNEVQKMKSRFVYDKISFFDLLSVNLGKIVQYVKNDDFVESFKSVDICKIYPLYCVCLNTRFESAIHRNNMFKKAIVAVSYAMPFLDSDHLVIRKIASYLNEDDLRNINYLCVNSHNTDYENLAQLNHEEEMERIEDFKSDDDNDDDDIPFQKEEKKYIQL